jgi:hypothetical protein
MSFAFPIEIGLKQGDFLSPPLSHYALEYGSGKEQETTN